MTQNKTNGLRFVLIFLSIGSCGFAQLSVDQPETPSFQKLVLTDKYYCDGIDSADINGDGMADIVAGPFWYEGPSFKTAHEFYEAKALDPEPSPSDSMFSFTHDFNRDGRTDILVLGRVHKHAAFWYENTGEFSQVWPKHFVFERVRGESPTLAPLIKNQEPCLLTHWDGRWGYLQCHSTEPQRPWRFVTVGENEDWPQFYHGQGIGDLNSDGRLDVIINDGWYEQPQDLNQLWQFHRQRFSEDRGGAQMFTYDVDGDGDNDVITAINAHFWGLSWFEHLKVDGKMEFKEHRIMGSRDEIEKFGIAFSQPHALEIADLDGDGLKDIVCGKRRWAHGPNGDIEPNAAPVVYWFQLQREDNQVRYQPHLIDDNSGVGVQICVKDVNGDHRPDVMTTSKLGTFVFLNRLSKTGR